MKLFLDKVLFEGSEEEFLSIKKFFRKTWKFKGKFHRVDGPALIFPDREYWYQNGVRHRTDGPSYIAKDGTKEWCQYGKLHRDDGPALIRCNGTYIWSVNGVVLEDFGLAWWFPYELLDAARMKKHGAK